MEMSDKEFTRSLDELTSSEQIVLPLSQTDTIHLAQVPLSCLDVQQPLIHFVHIGGAHYDTHYKRPLAVDVGPSKRRRT